MACLRLLQSFSYWLKTHRIPRDQVQSGKWLGVCCEVCWCGQRADPSKPPHCAAYASARLWKPPDSASSKLARGPDTDVAATGAPETAWSCHQSPRSAACLSQAGHLVRGTKNVAVVKRPGGKKAAAGRLGLGTDPARSTSDPPGAAAAPAPRPSSSVLDAALTLTRVVAGGLLRVRAHGAPRGADSVTDTPCGTGRATQHNRHLPQDPRRSHAATAAPRRSPRPARTKAGLRQPSRILRRAGVRFHSRRREPGFRTGMSHWSPPSVDL
eukprot:356082-Chlamydomonas_euryale.AAC.5